MLHIIFQWQNKIEKPMVLINIEKQNEAKYQIRTSAAIIYHESGFFRRANRTRPLKGKDSLGSGATSRRRRRISSSAVAIVYCECE